MVPFWVLLPEQQSLKIIDMKYIKRNLLKKGDTMMNLGLFKKINTAGCAVLFLVIFAGCGPESKTNLNYKNTNQASNSNIVGGVDATEAYQKQNGIVQLVMQTQVNPHQDAPAQYMFSICTGTLIAKNLILTAAHCVAKQDLKSIMVIFNLNQDFTNSQNIRFAVQAVVHPEFLKNIDLASNNSWNDIALLKLNSDAPTDFNFARLPSLMNTIRLIPNLKVSLAGFGITSPIANRLVRKKNGTQEIVAVPSNTSGILRKIDGILVKKISSDKKEIILDQSKSIGPCHGDSGGPAFITASDGITIQVGITSRSSNKIGNCNETAIYTNVSSHLIWISETGLKLQDQIQSLTSSELEKTGSPTPLF